MWEDDHGDHFVLDLAFLVGGEGGSLDEYVCNLYAYGNLNWSQGKTKQRPKTQDQDSRF